MTTAVHEVTWLGNITWPLHASILNDCCRVKMLKLLLLGNVNNHSCNTTLKSAAPTASAILAASFKSCCIDLWKDSYVYLNTLTYPESVFAIGGSIYTSNDAVSCSFFSKIWSNNRFLAPNSVVGAPLCLG